MKERTYLFNKRLFNLKISVFIFNVYSILLKNVERRRNSNRRDVNLKGSLTSLEILGTKHCSQNSNML
jgi:hypothetical protein